MAALVWILAGALDLHPSAALLAVMGAAALFTVVLALCAPIATSRIDHPESAADHLLTSHRALTDDRHGW